MTICYLTVKPQKLSNRELAKVFETLKRQGQIKDEDDKKLATTIGKSHYVRTYHRYVTIRLPQSKLDAFIERTKIDDSDIQTVRGGISRDLTALEQELEEDEAVPDYKYPSLPLIPTGNAHKSILETIKSMDAKPFNLEENANRLDNMNVTLSTPYDPDEDATDINNLSSIPGEANQNSVDLEETQQLPQQIKKTSQIKKTPILTTGVDDEDGQGEDKARSNGYDLQLDAGLSIPIWKKGRDGQEEILNTRMFIRDLQRLKSLGVLKREALLINAALVKSERTQLYEELPAEAETSVDEMVKYLKKAYGMNRFDMMKEVQNIKQGPNENPHSFLSRVITMYYEAKGKVKKSTAEIMKSEDETFEIVGLFWKGLYDERVKIILKQRMDEIKFEDLGDVTKNIESSYDDSQSTAINLINNQEDIKDETNVLHIGKNKNQNDGGGSWNYRSRFGRTNYRPKTCFCCGRFGHLASQCWFNNAHQISTEESSDDNQ